MEEVKISKYLFSALFSLAFLANFGITIISPLMGIMRADILKTSALWMALIFGLFPIFRAIFSPVSAKCMEKYSLKKMLLTGVIIYTVLSFLYMAGVTVWFLSAIRIIQGIAAAFVFTITITYTGLVPHKVGIGTTLIVLAATMLGLALGPLVGGVIYEYLGYNSVFIVMGLIECIGVFLVWFFIPEIKTSNINHKNIVPTKKTMGELTKYHLSWIIVFFQFGVFCQLTMYLSYLAIFVRDKNILFSISDIGIILFLMIIILTVLIYPIGMFSEKLMKDKFQHFKLFNSLLWFL